MDHDQRFKELIREFFADFLRLFFAVWAVRFDLDAIEWLDKEIFPNPPEGPRHHVDMVAKLRLRQQSGDQPSEGAESWLALVHIEIESADSTTNIKRRLPTYYVHLRNQHQLPVLPIVIFLKVGLDGVGVDIYEEKFFELTPMRFEFLYVGLPGLDAIEYVQGENWLGVALAALMRIPKDRVAWLGAEALRRLHGATLTDQQKFLLADCVEAYLPLDEEQRIVYDKLVSGTQFEKVRAMNKTSFEKGIETGIEKGIEQGLQRVQNILLGLGNEQFGQTSREVESQVRSIRDLDKLQELTMRVLKSHSWDELLQKD